jgi:hypothetical protein
MTRAAPVVAAEGAPGRAEGRLGTGLALTYNPPRSRRL